MFVKAEIRIKDSGPASHTAASRGINIRKGDLYTTTNVSDIRYFMTTGVHDVTITTGKLDEELVITQPVAPVEHEEAAEVTEDEPAAEATEDEPAAEPAEDEPAEEAVEEGVEGEQPVEEPAEEAVPEDAASTLSREQLEGMSKAALLQYIDSHSLDAKASMGMAKPKIIDAIMAAQQKGA